MVLNRSTIAFYFGAALLITSAVKFYTQAHPPHAFLFRDIYLSLHGQEWPDEDDTDLHVPWAGSSCYTISQQQAGNFYILDCVDANRGQTIVRMRVMTAANVQVDMEDAKRRLGSMFLALNGSAYPCTSKMHRAGRELDVTLSCPQIAGWTGPLRIYHFNPRGIDERLDFSVQSSLAQARQAVLYGTNVWGFSAFAAIAILIAGLVHNPLQRIRAQLASDLDWLRQERCALVPEGSKPNLDVGLRQMLNGFEQTLFESYRAQYETVLGSPMSHAVVGVAIALIAVVFAVAYAALHFGGWSLVGPASHALVPGSISTRLDALEAGRHFRTFVLIAAGAVGMVAIALNWALCVFRVRHVCRSVVQSRLAKYRLRLETSDVTAWEPFEASLTCQEAGLRNARASFRTVIEEADDALLQYERELANVAEELPTGAARELRRAAKRYRKDFEKCCKLISRAGSAI